MKMNEDNEIVHGSMALFSSFICGIAILLSYATPKQRKFPNVVLIWICISDFLYSAFIAMQYLPGPLKKFLNEPAGTPLCFNFETYLLLLVDTQAGIVGVFIAYILYSTIVNRVSFDVLSIRYRWYIAVIWIVSLVYPLVVISELFYPAPEGGPCVMSKTNSTFMIVPWAIMILFQAGFTIPVIRYIMLIKSAVQSYSMSTDCSRMHIWLYLRFSAIILGRLVLKIVMACYYMSVVFHQNSIVLKEIYTFIPIILSMNGLIVLFKNRLIKERVRQILVQMQLLPPLPEKVHNPSRRESTMPIELSKSQV